jgi:large subunit ribosomal protein L21
MYAVIESGGKQYRVDLGSEIQVDRLDVQPGDSIMLDRVLLVADGDATAVGHPVVDGASVSAEVLRQERGEKVIVFKYKPKARTRVKKGARAELTRLRISDIAFGGRSAAKDAKASESQQAKAAKEAEQAAAEKAAADQALAAQLATAEAAAEPATPPISKAKAAPRKSQKPTEPEVTAEPEPAAEAAGEQEAAAQLEPAAEAAAEPDAAEVPEAAEEPEPEPEGAETDTRKDD